VKQTLRILATALALNLVALYPAAQRAVAPPPKHDNRGPSLAQTMLFIQDKMNGHGQVSYMFTGNVNGGYTYRQTSLMSDVSVDSAACTLQATATEEASPQIMTGEAYSSGAPVLQFGPSTRTVKRIKVQLKDVEGIIVENAGDHFGRFQAENGHPEATGTVAPAVFDLSLAASKSVFFVHRFYLQSGESRPKTEYDGSFREVSFTFRDEDSANRVAKALTHAIELCGGGNKDPF
jgi:hypothetical protein